MGRRVGVLCLVFGLYIPGVPGCGAPEAFEEHAEPPPEARSIRSGLDALLDGSVPWVSFYGTAEQMRDLWKVARTFRIINIDADPGVGNFTPEQIGQLKAGGRNRVISYLNLGSCERFRDYWREAPPGLVPCRENWNARLGTYPGYADEIWMNLGDPDYQRLILEHVAPRLVAQGVDGFFLDNLELVERPALCDAACVQGGLDLVRRLRERYPDQLLIMQNATSDVTRLGVTGGVPFPTLLDGISREEVYAPDYEPWDELSLLRWQAMGLHPGHRFWIATEDYVGSCTNVRLARKVYLRSRAMGFSPYAADSSGGQDRVCFWKL